MNSFTVLFLCVQACLVQSVFSQCFNLGCGLGLASIAPTVNFTPAAFAPAAIAPAAAGVYGSAGEGNVAVADELPVTGTTAVIGQVPIMGAVRFGGDLYAGGAVTVTGNCACDCDAPFIY